MKTKTTTKGMTTGQAKAYRAELKAQGWTKVDQYMGRGVMFTTWAKGRRRQSVEASYMVATPVYTVRTWTSPLSNDKAATTFRGTFQPIVVK